MEAKDLANIVKKELQQGIDNLLKSGQLSKECFERNSLSSPKSILHSRILGLLARINLEERWVVDIERGLKPSIPGRNQFKPDVIIWNPSGKMEVVIEYESINSSDLRVLWNDLENEFLKYIPNPSEEDGIPSLWIIITTLKDGPVDDWSSWDWAKGGDFYQRDRLWNSLLKSPLKFWRKRYIPEFKKALKKTKNICPIFWMNINSGRVSIEFP